MRKVLGKVALLTFCLFSAALSAAELADRDELKLKVERYFLSERFAELDELAALYRMTEERTNSGLWKLAIFYRGISQLADIAIKDEQHWHRLKVKAEKWIARNPESPTALIAKGMILSGYAWHYRGGSWAREVPKEAWKHFKENLIVADHYMSSVKAKASIDPHWYTAYVNIKKGLGENKVDFKRFIKEGLDRYPDYYALYTAAIDFLSPRWHGDDAEVERFANQAVARTRESEGVGFYARIYWYVAYHQYNERIFQDSLVAWDKMRRGIFDVIALYPDQWNIQNFAFYACLANDRGMTKVMFEKIRGPIIEDAWRAKGAYKRCKDFANMRPGSFGLNI